MLSQKSEEVVDPNVGAILHKVYQSFLQRHFVINKVWCMSFYDIQYSFHLEVRYYWYYIEVFYPLMFTKYIVSLRKLSCIMRPKYFSIKLQSTSQILITLILFMRQSFFSFSIVRTINCFHLCSGVPKASVQLMMRLYVVNISVENEILSSF